MGITAGSREVPGRNACDRRHTYLIIIIIIIIISACPILVKEQYIKIHKSVHNYTSTYARKQGYDWTKNTGMNMCQNQ